MLVVSANYSLQSIITGICFILLLFFVYCRDKKADIEKTVNDGSELINKFRTTFIQYKDSALNHMIKTRLSSEVGDYFPPWWYSPHIGTLFAFGHDPNVKYETEIFESEESMFTVDWYPSIPSMGRRKDPLNVIVFFPGLGLTSKNKFAQNFVKTVADAGYYTAIVGARGIDIPLKTNKFWHPGMHDDALTAVEHIHQTHPHANIYLTGYSAGSNITQRTILHSRGKRCGDAVKGAMCVCVNYDYLTSRKNLEGTFIGSVYSMLMTYALKETVKKNAHVHHMFEGGGGLISRLLTSCTFMSDYDRLFAKHLHGYESLEKMNSCLSMHELGKIDIPLLAIQPSDDPLHMGRVRDNIALDKVTENPHIVYLEPRHGNHFGFYEGGLTEAFSNTTSYTYPAKLAVSFFNAIQDHNTGVLLSGAGAKAVGGGGGSHAM